MSQSGTDGAQPPRDGGGTQRIKEVFDEAADLPRGERAAFLDSACNGDAGVRAQVESLLRAMDESRDFLARVEAPRDDGETPAGVGEGPGDVIGRYELLELIGEGGFGSVFLAEQREPVRRRVALKIIKPGMDTRQVIARFEAERQALAMMDHPGVARVLDAGATARGRPYFVMDLARGAPITEFCDEHGLDVRARLELFVQVCRAVQHAHGKGVIHRDLKPSNVLVADGDGPGEHGRPAAKIIDFGIAKAVTGRLTDETITGDQRPLLGTPEYMSPEQAAGAGDVDIRSDVYSLGAMLYELLTGSPPLEGRRLRAAPWDEALRMIREEDPARASARIVAAGGPAARARQVRGELDWICAKCLEKSPQRRYETASDLAADIERHLDGEPVLAAPPSRVYRARKFVRRNRVAVVGGGLVAASLLLGLVGTATFAVRESRQRAAVEARAAELDRVAAFQSAMLSEIDPAVMGRRLREDLLAEATEAWQRGGVEVGEIESRREELERLLAGVNFTSAAMGSLDRNILHGALEAARREFAGEPLVQARLLQTLASLLRELGLYERAEPAQREALAIRRALLGEGDRDRLSSTNELAMLLRRLGRLEEAEALYAEALAGRRRWLGPDDPQTLESINNMGVLLQAQGRLDEALAQYRVALAGRQRVLGAEHPDAVQTLSNIGLTLQAQGELDAAARALEEAVRLRRADPGPEHPDTLAAVNALGGLRKAQGDRGAAEALYVEALAGRQRALGEDHPETLVCLNNLGALLHEIEGREADAERYLARAVAGFERALGPDHARTLGAMNNLGFALGAQGRWQEAEERFADALARAERALGDDHPAAAPLRENLQAAREARAATGG